MDSSWLLQLLSAAVLVATILLLVVCVNCRNVGPLGSGDVLSKVSIQQTPASEDYVPSTEFRIIPSFRPHIDPTSMNSRHSSLLRPAGSETKESDSNCSYENPGPEFLDSDPDDPEYIRVLPDGEAPPTLSRASTPSSDAQPDYVNIVEDPDYVNVEPGSSSEGRTESSAQSDEDDEKGNYVNQPTMIHIEPSA